MKALLLLSVIVVVLGVILSRPQIAKLLRGFLQDPKELALFTLFLLVEVGLVATMLAVFGPNIAGAILLASAALLAIWATRPPAKRG